MKTLILLTFFAVNLCYGENNQNQPKAHISLILGKVFIMKSDDTKWLAAKINQVVNFEDKIRCEKRSRCEIKLGIKKILRIGELTSIIVKEHAKISEIEVEKGKIWLNIILEGEKLNLKTPTSVASIRGTIYRAEADTNLTQFRVYEGEVGVLPIDGNGELEKDSMFVVTPGQEFVITKDVEMFIEREQAKAKAFIENDKSDFENYMKQNKDQFNDYRATQKKDFEEYQSFQILKRSFDPEEDVKDEWVKWNKELDSVIER